MDKVLMVDPAALAMFDEERQEHARRGRECHEKLARDYAGLIGSVSPIALHCYWTGKAHLEVCRKFASAAK
jgi:hypothetical protein